ncbi:MAG: amidase [Arenicellales bacterium WSBS_2016_MAG_OTU3]
MLHALGITEALALLVDGQISAVEVATDCLKRIDEFDVDVQAWAHLDKDHVMRQAEARDADRRKGKRVGRLHGVPIAIKDIIDTALVPTEHGCSLFSGRIPKYDATLVQRLRLEGAVIMGKTVTTQLATFAPGKTTNPHNKAHTPGGSSSGSAAAVAAFMVPGAVGTQTNGSVIRPAAYCGTVGYKPTYGLLPRNGILRQSPFLDQAGVFARSVEDAALLAEVMLGPDALDEATLLKSAKLPLSRICKEEPPLPPKFALVKTSIWEQTEQATRTGFSELADALGGQIEEVDLPASFEGAWGWQKIINEAEMATYYGRFYDAGADKIHATTRGQIESGREIKVTDYLFAREQRDVLNGLLDDLFQTYDALITPSATGEAPEGLASTGSPAFCSPWTFCGVPAITLPLLQGEKGLPIGVQLVGQSDDDGRLLRTARWLQNTLDAEVKQ